MKTRIWHHDDADGFASLFAVWLLWNKPTDLIAVPIQYGAQPIPEANDGDEVLILDFSYPREKLEALAKLVKLTVIDHHRTAAQDCNGLPFCTFSMEKAGCTLTADTIQPRNGGSIAKHQRDLIERVADRDLWRFAYSDTRLVCAGLDSYEQKLSVWENLRIENLANEGAIVQRAQQRMIEAAIKKYHFLTVDGVRGVGLNCTAHHSAVANTLLKMHPECKFACCYYTSSDGCVCYSLRGRGDFDVSELCKRFQGGGHFSASGCNIKALQPSDPRIIHEWITP